MSPDAIPGGAAGSLPAPIALPGYRHFRCRECKWTISTKDPALLAGYHLPRTNGHPADWEEVT